MSVFMADPDVAGRYDYTPSLDGFNFERGEVPLDQLLNEMERLVPVAAPPGLYAGAVPLRGGLRGLADDHPMPLLEGVPEQLAVARHAGICRTTSRPWSLLFPQYANLSVPSTTPWRVARDSSTRMPPTLSDFAVAAQHGVATLLPGDAIFIRPSGSTTCLRWTR